MHGPLNVKTACEAKGVTEMNTEWAKSRYTDALLIGCYTVYLLLAHSV